jgi:hypothetical protein
MKSTLVMIILIATGLAKADLNGHWIGNADWSYDGSSAHCLTTQFSYEESDSILYRKLGVIDCDYVYQEYPELKFEKKSGELWIENVLVGHYSGNHYQWIEKYSDTVLIEVTADRTGNSMNYFENWIGPNSETIYQINARLFTH